MRIFSMAAVFCAVLTPAFAQDASMDAAAAFEATLHYRHGRIQLPGGIASLNLPASFKYLEPADAKRVLEDAWGNPKGAGDGNLGMLFPEEYAVTDGDAWGVVISYENDGHVADDDASEIDYEDLLEDMREDVENANAARRKQGIGEVRLVGWGEPPHYDQASHKLYWAKQLNFAGAADDTLNYNIRVLGREGVLVLNAVAGMTQLAAIKPHMEQVVGFTEFSPGNRYEDFREGVDKTAAYGLSALIAGGIAAKTGLLAKLIAVLVAAKKLVIVALAGVAGLVSRWFKGRKAA